MEIGGVIRNSFWLVSCGRTGIVFNFVLLFALYIHLPLFAPMPPCAEIMRFQDLNTGISYVEGQPSSTTLEPIPRFSKTRYAISTGKTDFLATNVEANSLSMVIVCDVRRRGSLLWKLLFLILLSPLVNILRSIQLNALSGYNALVPLCKEMV